MQRIIFERISYSEFVLTTAPELHFSCENLFSAEYNTGTKNQIIQPL